MARGTNRRPNTWGPWVKDNKAATWYERTPKWKLAEIVQELAVQVDGPAPHEADSSLWFANICSAEQIVDRRCSGEEKA